MKKALCLLLALTMMFTMFTACGQKKEPAPEEPATKTEETPAEPAAAPEAPAEAEVVTYFCSVGSYLDLLTAEINKWNEGEGKEKGVFIEFSSNIDDYDNTNFAMLQSGNGADIFDDGYTEHSWVENGWVRDLNTVPGLEDLIADYKDTMVESVNSYKGALIALPLEVLPIKMAINMDLFEKNGLEVPKTWDDVVAAAKVITENGNGEDYGYGFTYKWSPYGYRRLAMKPAMCNTGVGWFNNNTGAYDFSPFKGVIEAHKKLYEDGSMFPDPAELGIDEIRSHFAAGHVGMITALSYDIGVYNNQFPAECNWKVIDCPADSAAGAKYKGVMLNRAGCSINSNVTDERLGAVAEAFKFLNSHELHATLYANCVIIPHEQDIRENTEITTPLTNWEAMSDCTNYAFVNEFPDSVITIEGDNYAQVFEAVMTGDKAWDEVIDDLNKRYNDGYQAAKKDGTASPDLYEYTYDIKR